ncbi:MAG: hypothetical protein H0T89_13900 [Deltaproteobacteria bacterium]|nr:hypothetical protein [Deltaproteobacteria bacterium]MDQ3301076.1 hypothetical protein [Myxococcota bacterium]
MILEAAREDARGRLEQFLAGRGLSGLLAGGERRSFEDQRAMMLGVIADELARSYARVDAALGLAVIGDPAGIPILRRVFDERMFAITNSGNERGAAALALALLDDLASIERVRGVARINLSASFVDLALAILERRA